MDHRSSFEVLPKLLVAVFCFCSLAAAQAWYQDTQEEVRNLGWLMSRKPDPSDVLLTSLDTILHDREICCGEDSALGNSASAADPGSLKDVASKIAGRHLLSDGRPILVEAEYLTPEQVSAGHMVQMFKDQHAALMLWNSHLYVVHGIVYFWAGSNAPEGGSVYVVIRKFLLWDTRYSDSRRQLEFNRETDDPSQVQGLLFVRFTQQ